MRYLIMALMVLLVVSCLRYFEGYAADSAVITVVLVWLFLDAVAYAVSFLWRKL